MITVGVISDTHGLLRPEAVEALRGSDHILHAGDVGNAGVLAALRELAPVTAVRGNNDRGSWAEALPHDTMVALGGASLYLLHDRGELDLEPRAAGLGARRVLAPKRQLTPGRRSPRPDRSGARRLATDLTAVICGHSHKPLQEERDGVLHFNPGSAGPRRFSLPITVGRLQIRDGRISAEIIPLFGSTSE